MKKSKKHLYPKITTRIGKFVDRLTYGQLLSISILIILFFSLILFLTNDYGFATNKKYLSITESLHYSISTFTSLGETDIKPVKLGVVLFFLEGLLGVICLAIFIGKIASEKTNAILLLTYTSEQQKRVIKFEKDLAKNTKVIDDNLNEHEYQEIEAKIRTLENFVISIHNYLLVQSNQGKLGIYGNKKTLKKLYSQFLELQQILLEAFQTKGVSEKTRRIIDNIFERIRKVGKSMRKFHKKDEKIINIFNKYEVLEKQRLKWDQKRQVEEVAFLSRSVVTERMIQKVKELLPIKPWSKGIHKQIAKKLYVSNTYVSKCITILINRKEI